MIRSNVGRIICNAICQARTGSALMQLSPNATSPLHWVEQDMTRDDPHRGRS